MGVGISDWRLAQAACMAGALGVVSGTALDVILARRLQRGDTGGHVRRALARLPIPGVAQRILDRYFVAGEHDRIGKPDLKPFKSKPMPSESPSRAAIELMVAGAFVEVSLAREGHDRPVGINLLEKIQPPTMATLYGAMLAGVACVLMGAGIPRTIPGVLDQLSRGEPAELGLDVQGAQPGETFVTRFDPGSVWPGAVPELCRTLQRPDFIAIVSSATLATMLAKKSTGRVDGFVVEGPTAGGHNAPPRGAMQLSESGEPVYGERDGVDLEAIRALGKPFWLAGSYARPERLAEALAQGATGVQVGTAFAYCEESGMDAQLKRRVLDRVRRHDPSLQVFTDPRASPTGFPFKLVQVNGRGVADGANELNARPDRLCDLGYLRSAFRQPDGTLGWRCPAEPIEDYLAKGGAEFETQGRRCLCNGLLATIGLGQVRGEGPDAYAETPLVTSGDDLADIARFFTPGKTSYAAADVIEALMQGAPATECGA